MDVLRAVAADRDDPGLGRLGLDDVGAGEPALVCVPGWCGDRDVFDPLRPLAAAHRRVLALDLPGHGGSDPVADDFGYPEVVDAVVATLDRHDVGRAVPLALSHAGWTALELRGRLGPERIPAVVLLDWMVLGPVPGFVDALAGLQQPESWQGVRGGLFSRWTSGVEVPYLHDYVHAMAGYGYDMWSRAGREIASRFAAEGSPLAALERMAQAGRPCPTLHVYAQPADDTVLAAQQAYAAEHSWFQVHRLDALSHFPTFEVPEELAEVVERFVASVG